jgi:hypothetical protein
MYVLYCISLRTARTIGMQSLDLDYPDGCEPRIVVPNEPTHLYGTNDMLVTKQDKVEAGLVDSIHSSFKKLIVLVSSSQ